MNYNQQRELFDVCPNYPPSIEICKRAALIHSDLNEKIFALNNQNI
jgi:hypothetical protein